MKARCECEPGIISHDCPVSYANGAHADGTARGRTPDELAALAHDRAVPSAIPQEDLEANRAWRKLVALRRRTPQTLPT